MPEPLTTSLVLDELKRLHVAFPQNVGMRSNPAGTAEVYRNGLRGLSGDAVRAAADRAIQDGEFFPKVAKLRELASTWMRHNQPAATELAADTDPLWCARCQSRATWLSRWRPRVNVLRRHEPILSPDGEMLMLESYERLLCRCASPCAYSPKPDTDPPQMRVLDIGKRVDGAA